jgi:hypothetical protein
MMAANIASENYISKFNHSNIQNFTKKGIPSFITFLEAVAAGGVCCRYMNDFCEGT